MYNIHIEFDNVYFSYFEYQKNDKTIKNLPKHMHLFYEVLFVWEGSFTYVIEDKTYHVKRGDLILINQSTYHFIKEISSDTYCRFCFHFPKNFIEENLLNKVFANSTIISIDAGSTIEKLFYSYYLSIQDESVENVKTLYFCYLYSILFSINKDYISKHSNSVGKKAHINTNGYNLINYINNNFTKINKIEDISKEIFLSPSFINHYFKNNLDISPMRFIRNKKILHAYNLIENGQRPTDVYLECGFSNYVTFYRQYLSIFGHPPTNHTKDKSD